MNWKEDAEGQMEQNEVLRGPYSLAFIVDGKSDLLLGINKFSVNNAEVAVV